MKQYIAEICVADTWHQGSVIAACLADAGHTVKAVANEADLSGFNRGNPPVHEPLLPELITRNLEAGRLRFTTDIGEALAGAEFAYLSVDTPVAANDIPNVRPVEKLARSIGSNRSGDLALIVTAQVPVGTTDILSRLVMEPFPNYRCDFAHVPEFLRLGNAVELFRNPDRIVIGSNEEPVAARIAAIYEPLGRPIVRTSVRTAEMAKHAANAFLATSISFANEIADLCESLGADARDVERILKLDPCIGDRAFLGPGLGFAGCTLGREVRTLQRLGHQHRVDTALVNGTWRINKRRPGIVPRRLQSALGTMEGRQVGILGPSYKAGTSTLRRATCDN